MRRLCAPRHTCAGGNSLLGRVLTWSRGHTSLVSTPASDRGSLFPAEPPRAPAAERLTAALFGTAGTPSNESHVRTLPLDERFSNVEEAALFVSAGGAVAPFLKSPRDGSTRYASATEAMGHLPSLLTQAARLFHAAQRDANVPPPPHPSHHGEPLVRSPVFVRSILEQVFLHVYLDDGEASGTDSAAARLRQCTPGLYPYSLTLLSDDLMQSFEEALRCLLQATAFSLHLAVEAAMRRGERRHGGDRGELQKVLVVEVFALWWWANPDLVGFERRGVERFLPLNCRAYRALAGQAGTGAARTLLPGESLFEDHLWGLLAPDLETASGHATEDRDEPAEPTTPGQHHQTTTFRQDVVRTGGFLTCDRVFCPVYRQGLARVWQTVPHQAHYISCALVPRMVQVALSASDPVLQRRGEALVSSLLADWVGPVLCRPAAQNRRATGLAEHWWVVFASLAALTALTNATDTLRRSRKTFSPVSSKMLRSHNHGGTVRTDAPVPRPRYGDVLTRTESDYLSQMRRLAAPGEEATPASPPADGAAEAHSEALNWARHVFRLCALSCEAAGLFHSRLAERPSTTNALWLDLTERLSRAFPECFVGGTTTSTLWTLVALQSLSVPSHFARETALAEWRRRGLRDMNGATGALSGPPPHSSTRLCREEEDEAVPRTVWLEEGVYVPTWSARSQSQWVACTSARDAPSEGDATMMELGEVAHHSATNEARTDRAVLVPSFASSLPLLQSSLAMTASVTETGMSPPMEEILLEARSVACAIFRAYAATPSHTDQTPPTTMPMTVAPPSLYVFLQVLHLLARLGEPANPLHTVARQDAAALRQTPSYPLAHLVMSELLPQCHRVLQGKLEKLCAAYIAHSAGPGNAVALLTSERPLVDGLPPHVAWDCLMESLLWSGLPWNALESLTTDVETSKTSATPTDTAAAQQGASFGVSSLAWEVMRTQQFLLLSLSPSRDATESDSRLPYKVLIKTLSHLLTLALHTPDTVRIATALYPAACDVVTHFPRDVVPPTGVPDRADEAEVEENAYEDEHSDAVDDDDGDDGRALVPDATLNAAEDAWAESLGADSDDAAHSQAATWVLDMTKHSPPQDEPHHGSPSTTDATANMEAHAVFLAALSTSPPSAEHVFHSLVTLLSWTVAPACPPSGASAPLPPSVHSFFTLRAARGTGALHATASSSSVTGAATVARSYVDLVSGLVMSHSITSCPLSDPWRSLLANRSLAELICLLVMHTVPDVWWLATLLVRWQNPQYQGLSHRATSRNGEHVTSTPRLFTKRMEASLAQLLHHSGVTCGDVRLWRTEKKAQQDHDGAALADPCHFHSATLADVLSSCGHSGTRGGDAQRQKAQLTALVGSLLLTSFETRVQQWPGKSRHAKLSLAEVVEKLHPHNHYLSCFFLSQSEAPRSRGEPRAIWPAYQLFTFRPSTSSAFNVAPALDLWWRDGRRLQRGARASKAAPEATTACKARDACTDADAYLSLFTPRH